MVKKRASLLMLNRWITRLCGGSEVIMEISWNIKRIIPSGGMFVPDCVIKDTFGIVRIVPCYIRVLNKAMSERRIKAYYRWFVQKNALKVQIGGCFGMKKRCFSQKNKYFFRKSCKIFEFICKTKKKFTKPFENLLKCYVYLCLNFKKLFFIA